MFSQYYPGYQTLSRRKLYFSFRGVWYPRYPNTGVSLIFGDLRVEFLIISFLKNTYILTLCLLLSCTMLLRSSGDNRAMSKKWKGVEIVRFEMLAKSNEVIMENFMEPLRSS